MKKLSMKLFIVMAILVCFTLPAFAVNYDYTAAVYKKDATKRGGSDLTLVSTGITFKVLTASSDTAATITRFGDNASTAVTNPVTAANFASTSVCNGQVRFRTTASTVDLIVVDTTGGYTAFIKGFSPDDHSIVIDETPNILHHGMIWFSASDNSETDTGVDFTYDTAIHDVWVEIVTIDATETLDVGLLASETSGDANGFRAAVAVGVAGYPTDTAVITGGSTIDYTPVTTYGALLVTAITGSDVVATVGGKSYIGPHMVTGANAKSLTYTGSADSDTAAGYIHYFFTRMR